MRKSALAIAIALLLSLFASHSASASTSATVSTEVEGEILWVEASVEASDADVIKINVRAPAKDGSWTMWQSCRFANVGAGIYRCGIDVGEGSLARKRLGTWGAAASVDGTLVGRTYFSIRT